MFSTQVKNWKLSTKTKKTHHKRYSVYLAAPSAYGWRSPWSPCETGKASVSQRWEESGAPWRGPALSGPCVPEGTWGVSQCCGPPSYREGSWRCVYTTLHLGEGRKPRGRGGVENRWERRGSKVRKEGIRHTMRTGHLKRKERGDK